jgi:hypothetical protein
LILLAGMAVDVLDLDEALTALEQLMTGSLAAWS